MKLDIKYFFLIIAAFIVLFISSLFIPYNINGLRSSQHPADTYEEAIKRIDSIRNAESPDMNTLCHTIFLSHSCRTDKVIVFFHGYTNCPEQFRRLGQQLFDSGFNVLVLPMRYHGLSDRLSTGHANLTAEYLAAYTD